MGASGGQSAGFDEDAALAQVVAENPKLSFEPGRKFAYSNIGYWLLGKIVEQVTGQSYADYVRTNIFRPLGLSSQEMDFVIPDPDAARQWLSCQILPDESGEEVRH